MLQILLHSSKTIASNPDQHTPLGVPLFTREAERLVKLWQKASTNDIAKLMQISATKAAVVERIQEAWSLTPRMQTPAIDAFRGDIYSGLQVASWTKTDRVFAHKHLIILSGLYGALRACDGIMPYRLEMGYKLPNGESMYGFWGDRLASAVSAETTHLINLSAVEYTKALLPHVTQVIITPKFMTVSPKTGEPTFVTVHAKIARGAFASWLIQQRIENPSRLPEFTDLDYHYNADLSTPEQPVFVCKTFQGLGLSVRIVK